MVCCHASGRDVQCVSLFGAHRAGQAHVGMHRLAYCSSAIVDKMHPADVNEWNAPDDRQAT